MLLNQYLEIQRDLISEALHDTPIKTVIIDDLGGVQRASRDIDTPMAVINWTTDNVKADAKSHAVRVSLNLLLALPSDLFVKDGRFDDNGITDALTGIGFEIAQAGNYNESLQIEVIYNKLGLFVRG